MKKNIQKLLSQIEKEHDIKILFAIENGSRAWGMESTDSDYDVRFVFQRKLEKYISIDTEKDVIIAAYDENMKPHETHGALIDMCGFDIFKFLKLLATSNPTTIEWIHSPIVYMGDNKTVFKEIVKQFNPEKLFKHYFSVFKNNYKLYIRDEKLITYKKYLYSMRGLLNALYVYHFDKIPPIQFKETIKKLKPYIPAAVVEELDRIIKIKSGNLEKETVLRIPVLDDYMTSELNKNYSDFKKRDIDRKDVTLYLQQKVLMDLKNVFSKWNLRYIGTPWKLILHIFNGIIYGTGCIVIYFILMCVAFHYITVFGGDGHSYFSADPFEYCMDFHGTFNEKTRHCEIPARTEDWSKEDWVIEYFEDEK